MKFDFTLLPCLENAEARKLQNKGLTITVVTPFYNSLTLEDTAKTLLQQTYPFFEWIIVDDGSTNQEALAILNRVEKLDKRISVFHKKNGGPAQARDFGIAKASSKTKYVFFLDADDMLDKTALECFYWSLETHKDASFVYAVTANFGDNEFIWDKYLTVEQEKYQNLICISSMVRKDDLLEVGCFGMKEKAMYEDWNLWLKLLAHGKKPIRLNAPLFWYRISNSGELSRARKNHKNAMKYIEAQAKLIHETVEVIQFPRVGQKKKQVETATLELPQYAKDKRKTILFLVPWYKMGGADIFNLEIIKRIDRQKFRVITCCSFVDDSEYTQEFKKYADEVYDMTTFLDCVDYPYFVDYLIDSRKVETIFLSNSSYGYAMIPFLKERHKDLTVIDYIHSIDFKDHDGGFGNYTSWFDRYLDMTYTCNNFTTEQLKRDFDKEKVETLYIGTDHEKFDATKYDKEFLKNKYHVSSDKKIISFVARLAEEKRPLLFLDIATEMLKRRNDLQFLIVGDGPFMKEVCHRAKRSNNQILVLGATSTPEEIYAISDITLNCSRIEGLALTSYESLAMGVPVISSDVGGQSELIDKTVGRLVPYQETIDTAIERDQYCAAIEEVLKDLEVYKKNARAKITKRFTLDQMITKIEKIFETTSPKKIADMNIGKMVYEVYLKLLQEEHNWLTREYTFKHYQIYLEDGNLENRNLKLKQKMTNIGYRYELISEFSLCWKFLKTFKEWLKAGLKTIYYGLKSLIALFLIPFKLFIKWWRR